MLLIRNLKLLIIQNLVSLLQWLFVSCLVSQKMENSFVPLHFGRAPCGGFHLFQTQ